MEHRLSGHDRMRNQLITNGKPRLARIFGQCSESELSSRDLRGEITYAFSSPNSASRTFPVLRRSHHEFWDLVSVIPVLGRGEKNPISFGRRSQGAHSFSSYLLPGSSIVLRLCPSTSSKLSNE